MKKKNLLIVSFVILLIMICILWFFKSKPILSEIGAELSQEEIEKDISILTKNQLRKVRIDVFSNGEIPKYTVSENGVVNKNSKIIQIAGKSKNSNYPEGLEYREAVRVLLYLNQRNVPYTIAGVVTFFTRSYAMDYERVAFISNKDFLEQLNANKNIKDEEQLIKIISNNLMKKKIKSTD